MRCSPAFGELYTTGRRWRSRQCPIGVLHGTTRVYLAPFARDAPQGWLAKARMAAPKNPQKGGMIEASDLRYFLRIFSQNWYFVVVAVVLSAVLSYLYSYKLPEVYGATTQILLKDRETYNYQSQVYQNIGYVAAYGDIVNQKRVLTSYDLIDNTLDKLDFDVSYYIIGRFKTTPHYHDLPFKVDIDLVDTRLYEKPFDLQITDPGHYTITYDKGAGPVVKTLPFNEEARSDNDFLIRVTTLDRITPSNLHRFTDAKYQFVRHSRPWLVNKYKAGLVVDNLEYTTILQVQAEDEVREKAKLFLDSLSNEYINYTLQGEFIINEKTIAYIDKQLDEINVVMRGYETELQDYRENKSILDLQREEEMYFNQLVEREAEQRRNDLRISALNDLERYVLDIGTEEQLLPPASYVLGNDEFLENNLASLHDLQMKRNKMMFRATGVNMGVSEVDSVIQLNRMNLLVYLRNERTALQENNRSIDDQVEAYKSMIRTLPASQRDMMAINRKLQVNEKLYNFLLEKRANTVIARAGIVPQTKVIERARIIGMVRPDKVKILYTFIVAGVVLSLLLVFVRVMFYDRIENAEQLRENTHLPIFGEIIASEKAEEHYVVVDSDPKSAITESFRTVRTNLEYLPATTGGKVVLVTSYRPSEGKTFCSVNLAAILSKAGKKVLLLELDMHKPKVATGLNMTCPTGMSNLLVGRATIDEVILPTQYENFWVILSGPTPPNASELVLSEQLQHLFEEGRKRFDYVLIDTPPVGLITDALVMMKHVDATLFVINTRFASKDHVKNAMEAHAASTVRNFGFILNGVRMKRSKYYYNTNYGYGYRYAYGYGSGYGYGYGYGYGRKRRSGKDTRTKPPAGRSERD